MSQSHSIFIAMRPALYDVLFADEQKQRLGAMGDLSLQDEEGNLTEAQLTGLIGGHDIVITSWGTPTFTENVLAAAARLKLIAHSAGTIKKLLPPSVFADGRRVTHVAYSMSVPVAETTLAFILLCLRNFHKISRAFHEKSWVAAKGLPPGDELAGNRVGVIGAGYTGRAVIRRLLAMDAEVWLYDPYLSEDSAAAIGVHKVGLEPLMRECPIVTVQAPATVQTYRMIGAKQLSWLKDGAIFINTSRGRLIDEDALLAELRSGRFSAALDVFDQEPLPDDSPFRGLDNVIITPHVAAVTHQAYKRQGQITADEVASYLRNGKLRYEVTRDMLDTMA